MSYKSECLNDDGDTLSSTDACCSNTILSTGSLQLMGERERETSSCCGKWVSETNCTAVDIDFVLIKAKFLDTGNGFACKCFVDFLSIDIFDGKTCAFQCFA